MASLHTLVRNGKRAYRRVGRGNGSTRGKQSGRGGKGQTARAGHKIRPAFRDLLKKLPKRRGFGKNRGRTVDSTIQDAVALSVTRLEQMFPNGGEISFAILREKGLIGRKHTPVKIVGGTTTKKFIVTDAEVSASARAVIEKAGGSVAEAYAPKPKARTAVKKIKKAKVEAEVVAE